MNGDAGLVTRAMTSLPSGGKAARSAGWGAPDRSDPARRPSGATLPGSGRDAAAAGRLPHVGPVLYVGVDGGGSTCRVRVRDAAGRICGQAVRGAANVYLDFAPAVATIAEAVNAALAQAAGHAAIELHLGLGLAGVSSAAIADRVRGALPIAAATLHVTSDADIACLGAHAGQDGGLIVAGTGSGGVARIAGRSVAIGGRGFVLGDDGSGARLGLEGLRLALRAHDGLVPHSRLTRELMARFAEDPVEAIAWGRSARSSDFAALAPTVIAAAADGDAAGVALVRASADAIAELAAALRRHGAPRLCFVGGLSAALRPFVDPGLAASFVEPVYDALDGALLLAGCPAAAIATAQGAP